MNRTIASICPTFTDADVRSAIATEFGDRFEYLSPFQRREAMAILSLAGLMGDLEIVVGLFHTSVSVVTLPRNFFLLSNQLTRDGWLGLSIDLADSIRRE
jgi:hypothetical protein